MLNDIVCFCYCYHYCTYELEKGFDKEGRGLRFLPSQTDLNYVHTFLCLQEKRTHHLVSCYISNVPVLGSSLLTVTTCDGSSYSHLLIRHCKRGSPSLASLKTIILMRSRGLFPPLHFSYMSATLIISLSL